MNSEELRIGVFDSGLGGLTVVQSMIQHIKGAKLFYIADTKNAPYGEKTPEQILQYSLNITQYLIDTHQIDALVVACNTATSAAIKELRMTYPNLIIIGTEPAIKPAIEQTNTGKVGVLATPATLRGDKYQALVDRVSSDKNVKLYEQACPGLVEHIENDTLESKESIALLEKWLTPMREANVDTIVLGCTHYPLAQNMIIKVMQKEVVLVDSGYAIAKRLLNLVETIGHKNSGTIELKLYSTGKIDKKIVKTLLNKPIELISL